MVKLSVRQALKKLGADIRNARKRRRITSTLMAERVGVTRVTLSRIEKGDPSVGMGNYAMALHLLGKSDALANLMNDDPAAIDIEKTSPLRLRTSKRGGT